MLGNVSGEVLNPVKDKDDEDTLRRLRRLNLKVLNLNVPEESTNPVDSSLKKHTALIKRMKQSLGIDNNEQILRDVASLSLEKYLDELAGAALEGILRCRSDRDVWSAVEIISAIHRRFPRTFSPALITLLSTALSPPPRPTTNTSTAGLSQTTQSAPPSTSNINQTNANLELKEKDDAARLTRQRPVLRVCSELALVGIIRDAPGRSGGEWIMKVLKDLLSNDPSLSSLPLLTTFLKSFSRPFLGLIPPQTNKGQVSENVEPGSLASATEEQSSSAHVVNEDDELVEKEIRARFKKMCEGYYENVSKKLVIEHKRLQEQDRRNHEAYIKSGEIFEDRQQAYERMTKAYEKLLAGCQTLSELLYLPMPVLPTQVQKTETIIVGTGGQQENQEELYVSGGKWEDEEERKFFEDIQDLRDFVPKSVLGIDEKEGAEESGEMTKDLQKEKERKEMEEREAKELEKELNRLSLEGENGNADPLKANGHANGTIVEEEDDDAATPVPSPPGSPPHTPTLAPQGPSQILTALLARLPDATNRTLIDQAAVDFAFLNSKAARKRLVKFLTQVPKNRIDLLPHYSRLVATLNKYMPDVGSNLVSALDDEFRYFQKKKNMVKEFQEARQKNIAFLSNLTKFGVVPSHVILHIFKVCLDDFSGVNIDNLALLLEGCGRYLLRSEETQGRFSTMVELMRRKQSLQHLDQRQILLLENAYYQCNPPEHAPRIEKERTPIELFIRHLVYDVLSKKTIDKVLKLIRKLDWNDPRVVKDLHSVFTKPWKIKYSNITLLAMLAYDLQRYHPSFSVAVVDQALEDIRRGLETNIYKANQQRVSTMKYLGELYIYRLIGSTVIFDTLWSLVTFGHPEGRPLPGQLSPIDLPDDFFRIRLVCVLLDTCGMCFEKGSQRKKLENFLTFFQLYILTKDPLPMDVEFMLEDSLEALRPKIHRFKTFEEAALAVDEMFNVVMQTSEGVDEGSDSGDDSEEDAEGDRHASDDEEEEEPTAVESPIEGEERPSSPDALVLLNAPENLGPSEEDEADFAKELARMVTDSSAEARKVDRKTAQALWDSSVLPTGMLKKKVDNSDDEDGEEDRPENEGQGVMKFVVLTKKGNRQQAKKIAIPAASALATHTRSAQLQDKVEQQHLKQLVLDYEHREEVEELRALETRSRNGGMKIRYVG